MEQKLNVIYLDKVKDSLRTESHGIQINIENTFGQNEKDILKIIENSNNSEKINEIIKKSKNIHLVDVVDEHEKIYYIYINIDFVVMFVIREDKVIVFDYLKRHEQELKSEALKFK